jgi:hypothetical protein
VGSLLWFVLSYPTHVPFATGAVAMYEEEPEPQEPHRPEGAIQTRTSARPQSISAEIRCTERGVCRLLRCCGSAGVRCRAATPLMFVPRVLCSSQQRTRIMMAPVTPSPGEKQLGSSTPAPLPPCPLPATGTTDVRAGQRFPSGPRPAWSCAGCCSVQRGLMEHIH